MNNSQLIPPGYKQTEVGVIPEDWEVSKLGTQATFKTGPFGSALHQSDYVDGGVPVINPMQIVDGKIQPTLSMAITEQAARKLSEFRLSAGNVVIGRRGEMGRCAFVQTEEHGWLCGTGSMIIRTGPSLDARFIQRVLSSPPIIAAIENAAVGSTMINLNQGTLGNLLVPLPPTKAEQEAIAEALSDADALIESLEQLLGKKRLLKQGAMQELLTGKKRLPGFFGEWEEKRLGELAEIAMGQSPSSAHYNNKGDGLPLIQGNADISGRQTIKRVFTTEVTKRGRSGDILMSVRAPVGEISRAVFDVCLGRGVCAIRYPNDFLYYALIAKEPNWSRLSKGSTFDSVNSTDVRAFEIKIPAAESEQTAIAIILGDMDTEIAAIEAKLAKDRQLKQGMMQELLTGRIRLAGEGHAGQ